MQSFTSSSTAILTVDGEVATFTGDVNSFYEKEKLETNNLDTHRY